MRVAGLGGFDRKIETAQGRYSGEVKEGQDRHERGLGKRLAMPTHALATAVRVMSANRAWAGTCSKSVVRDVGGRRPLGINAEMP